MSAQEIAAREYLSGNALGRVDVYKRQGIVWMIWRSEMK